MNEQGSSGVMLMSAILDRIRGIEGHFEFRHRGCFGSVIKVASMWIVYPSKAVSKSSKPDFLRSIRAMELTE
jgi:hypothetical protein